MAPWAAPLRVHIRIPFGSGSLRMEDSKGAQVDEGSRGRASWEEIRWGGKQKEENGVGVAGRREEDNKGMDVRICTAFLPGSRIGM